VAGNRRKIRLGRGHFLLPPAYCLLPTTTEGDMRRMTYLASLLAFVLVWVSARPDAADAVIRGVVTDSASKPIAGALVKANVGPKSTSRYTAADGRYELSVPPGKYELVVEAFGFELSADRSMPRSEIRPISR
jgi:hypothetical protein